MTIRVAINGFGRIGRSVVRALYEAGRHSAVKVVAINEVADDVGMAYLLKYDTSHRKFTWNVQQKNGKLFIGGDSIFLLHEKEIEKLPWNELDIDIVLDCTGIFGNRKHGEAHLKAGARKVLFSHLGEKDLDNTIIYGVNHSTIQSKDCIVSNGSCTSNCVIPIIKLLDDTYGIEFGSVTAIHSAMHDQKVIDTYHSNFHADLRLTRAAGQSIVPVNTRLSNGISRIFPQFRNKFTSIAMRVPTINVTALDLNVTVRKIVKDHDEVNLLLQTAAKSSFYGIINYTEIPLVSVDFMHDSHSAIVDGTQTRVSGSHFIKILSWCDNEWGFANRMIDTTLALAMADRAAS